MWVPQAIALDAGIFTIGVIQFENASNKKVAIGHIYFDSRRNDENWQSLY